MGVIIGLPPIPNCWRNIRMAPPNSPWWCPVVWECSCVASFGHSGQRVCSFHTDNYWRHSGRPFARNRRRPHSGRNGTPQPGGSSGDRSPGRPFRWVEGTWPSSGHGGRFLKVVNFDYFNFKLCFVLYLRNFSEDVEDKCFVLFELCTWQNVDGISWLESASSRSDRPKHFSTTFSTTYKEKWEWEQNSKSRYFETSKYSKSTEYA